MVCGNIMVEEDSGTNGLNGNTSSNSTSSVNQSPNKCIFSNNKVEERKCHVSQIKMRRKKKDEGKNTTKVTINKNIKLKVKSIN